MTEPAALVIVMLVPVVFITGAGVADGSIRTAFVVPLIESFFDGFAVPMATLPETVNDVEFIEVALKLPYTAADPTTTRESFIVVSIAYLFKLPILTAKSANLW